MSPIYHYWIQFEARAADWSCIFPLLLFTNLQSQHMILTLSSNTIYGILVQRAVKSGARSWFSFGHSEVSWQSNPMVRSPHYRFTPMDRSRGRNSNAGVSLLAACDGASAEGQLSSIFTFFLFSFSFVYFPFFSAFSLCSSVRSCVAILCAHCCV